MAPAPWTQEGQEASRRCILPEPLNENEAIPACSHELLSLLPTGRWTPCLCCLQTSPHRILQQPVSLVPPRRRRAGRLARPRCRVGVAPGLGPSGVGIGGAGRTSPQQRRCWHQAAGDAGVRPPPRTPLAHEGKTRPRNAARLARGPTVTPVWP